MLTKWPLKKVICTASFIPFYCAHCHVFIIFLYVSGVGLSAREKRLALNLEKAGLVAFGKEECTQVKVSTFIQVSKPLVVTKNPTSEALKPSKRLAMDMVGKTKRSLRLAFHSGRS